MQDYRAIAIFANNQHFHEFQITGFDSKIHDTEQKWASILILAIASTGCGYNIYDVSTLD
jgi:hypothetical protein